MTNIKTQQSEKPARRRGRPSKAEAGQNRAELLERAFDRFAERGFDGVSVRELAAELGVSDSLFHHYFGSKDQLWSEAVSHVIAPLQADVLEVMHRSEQISDPLARLRESTRMVLMWGVHNRRVFQLIFREAGENSERGALMRQYFEAFQQQVEAALLAAREQGRIRYLPLNSAHAMIVGAARMLVDPNLMAARLHPVFEDEAALTAFIDGIVDTLFLGLLTDKERKKS